MDTAVVITSDKPSESDVVTALRATGLRVLGRRMDIPASTLVAERPDVLVVDVPDALRLGPIVEGLRQIEGLADVPMVVVVGPMGMAEAASRPQVTDFVLRPLQAQELVARVRRQLASEARDDDDKIRLGRLLVDTVGYEARVDGSRLDLTYQEFELLKFLMCNPDRAFRRDELLARVWGYDYYGGSRTVDIHIRRIRSKLGHPYAACIQTIRHVGYKWVNDYE